MNEDIVKDLINKELVVLITNKILKDLILKITREYLDAIDKRVGFTHYYIIGLNDDRTDFLKGGPFNTTGTTDKFIEFDYLIDLKTLEVYKHV